MSRVTTDGFAHIKHPPQHPKPVQCQRPSHRGHEEEPVKEQPYRMHGRVRNEPVQNCDTAEDVAFVLGIEWGSRWNHEACNFIGMLAKAAFRSSALSREPLPCRRSPLSPVEAGLAFHLPYQKHRWGFASIRNSPCLEPYKWLTAAKMSSWENARHYFVSHFVGLEVTALVCPLTRTGRPHTRGEQYKGTTVPTDPGLVLGIEVGGRWSDETATFLRLPTQKHARPRPFCPCTLSPLPVD